MFEGAAAFDQDLGWCVGDDVNLGDAFSDTLCESTSCGVVQNAAGTCAPTPAPSPSAAAPDHPHWRWGAAGQSCDQACAPTGLACNAQPLATVTTLARFRALAGAINSPTTPDGITGVGGHTAPDQAPFSDIGSGNGVYLHLAFLSTGTPTCAGAHSNRARLCYCGAFDDTSIVTARDAWLADAAAAEAAYGHIATWGTGGVTHMKYLFCAESTVPDCNVAAASFNEDISAWDTSSVTNMRQVFRASAFNQTLGDWQVDQVADMRYMFKDAAAFNHPLNGWSVGNVGDMRSMFGGATDYDLLTKGLMMTNPLPYRSEDIDQLYKAYSSDRGEVYFEDWVKIAERLPMLLFALLRFQASVMKDNLGEPFWFKKKGDFDKLRTKLGVERANLLE